METTPHPDLPVVPTGTEPGKISVRKSDERGHFDHGWLDTRHTFSFAGYYDPRFEGFRDLRVINEDRVIPGEGFGTHAHRDMEILTYVLEGALAHRDSTGSVGVLKPGNVQRMSAGRGVAHSEFNGSKSEPVHFIQIWIIPDRRGVEPSWEEKEFPLEEKLGRLRLVASPDGAEGSTTIHQDARVYASVLRPGDALRQPMHLERYGWIQLLRGELTVNGVPLEAGDGAALAEQRELTIRSDSGAEFLLFDLN